MNKPLSTDPNSVFQSHQLPDTNQSPWELAAIQLTGVTSLPVLFTSIWLIQKNSLLNSIIILIIANLMLWLIRYGLILMSSQGRKSIMDLAEDFLSGISYWKNIGIYAIAMLLLLSAMSLFVEETTIVSNALTKTFSINEGPNIDPYMQISVIIGVASTIFCTWGIVALRRLSTFALPIILLCFSILLIFSSSKIEFLEFSGFSLVGLANVLAINLAVTADLPTFFRHSRSWKSSIAALTIIQLFSLALGIGGLFLGAIIQPLTGEPLVNGLEANSYVIKLCFILLVGLSSICSNVSNVYGASVGWETFFRTPKVTKKEYLILGFLLTLIFLIVTGLFSLEKPVNITSDSLVNLSFIFLIGYGIWMLKKSPIEKFEKNTYFIAWSLSTIIIILQNLGVIFSAISTLLMGLVTVIVTIGLSFITKYCIQRLKG